MALPLATKSRGGRIVPTPPRTGTIDSVRARVTAKAMLDILVALKMDLMQSAPSGIGDLQSRIDRAFTIDAAIDDLERVVGISGTTTTAQRRLLKRV